MIGQDLQLSDSNFETLRGIIHSNTGITIGDGRKGLLLSRLRSRLREINEPTFNSYIKRLETDRSERQELINRVTTNKTYCYRTPRIWEHFETVAIPNFWSGKHNRPMRVWSAASSTGEEAHTIGAFLENARQIHSSFDYSVLGTDVSSRVLEVAQKGVYAPAAISSFQKLKPDIFKKSLVGDDANGYRATAEIRSRLKFRLHNLQKQLSGTAAFDAVFLRNVLIYFTPEDQENILRHVRAVMTREATLYIGESESINRLDSDFESLEPMVYCPRTEGAAI